MRALYACTQPKIHTALHFIENSNVYHALLLSKASQFSCCAVQNISNSLVAYFFPSFVRSLCWLVLLLHTQKFKIYSVAVGLTDIWILWSFVRKRIHLKIKTFWFCLFLFSKQNISYLSMLFHFQQTFASSNLFRNIIMIMHKSLHFFYSLRLYQVSLLFGIQTELSLFALNWKNLQSDHKFGSIYLLFCGLSILYWASWLL